MYGKTDSLKNRIIQFDIFRGIILIYMAFVNAYHGLASVQKPWFAHNQEIMYPGDLIVVFFFFMVGFNLGLVQKFKKLSRIQLFLYGLKRGIIVSALGLVLITYSIVFYHNEISVVFQSFLVVLGIAIALMSGIICIIHNSGGVMFAAAAIFSLLLACLNWNPAGNYAHLSPMFLLTAVWGYLLSNWYLESKKKFITMSVVFGFVFLFSAALHIQIFGNYPTRQSVNAPYVFISWSFFLLSFAALFRYYRPPVSGKSKLSWVALSGAHPLSFWILHGIVIGLFLLVATLNKYIDEGMLSYFWTMPIMPRIIESQFTAIFMSVGAAFVSFFVHLLFIQIYRTRKLKNKQV
ncbi:MAG: hypothetical protein ABUK01_05400 [Leptospirales bacterium]